MRQKVLSVGQCAADDSKLRGVFQGRYPVDVVAVDTAVEAVEAARTGGFVLVLVNRVFDVDGDGGLDLIRRLKADATTTALPVMLVSNYPEAQAEAVALGALPGFGKAALGDKATHERLAGLLQ